MGRLRESLKKDAGYKAALNDKQSAQAQVVALRAAGQDDQILPIAQHGLEAGQRIAQIERDAIAKDPDVISARAHLAAAVAAHKAAQGGAVPQDAVNVPSPAASAK
jgi:hypothetical protein